MNYLLWLQGMRNDTVNVILSYITEIVTSPIIYLFVAVLYWCFAKEVAIKLALNLSVGTMINQTVKNIFCIQRPWIRNPEVKPVPAAMENATGYSFPSGHTQLAATEFLTIAVWQKKKKWIVALCLFMVMLVMFTRNYLGVHTVPDVIASLMIACFVVSAMPKVLDWVDKRKNRDILVTGIAVLVGILLLAYTTLKGYPMEQTAGGVSQVSLREMIADCYSAAGCMFGFFIGWILERRFVKFSTDVSAKTKWVRGVIGSIILLSFVVFAKDPMKALDPYWGNLSFFVIAFVLILFLYPLIFVWVEKLIEKKKHS